MKLHVQRTVRDRSSLQRRRPLVLLILIPPVLLSLFFALALNLPLRESAPVSSGEALAETPRPDIGGAPEDAAQFAAGEAATTIQQTVLTPDETGVIAVVNGVVLDERLWSAQALADLVMESLTGQPVEAGVESLDRLINGELVSQAAQAVGYSVTQAEVQAALAALLAQYGKDSDNLEAALIVAGMDRSQFDAHLHRLLTVDRFAAAQARAAGITPADYVRDLQQKAQVSFGAYAGIVLAQAEARPDSLARSAPAATSGSELPAAGGADVAESSQPITAEPHQAVQEPERGIGPGQTAPEFSLPLLGQKGATLAWHDLPGAPTLLSFWTTWCPYCRKQAPGLIAAQDRYASQGVRIVSINVGEDEETVANYVAGNGVNFPVALDAAAEAAERYAVSGFPTTYFLDAEGRVVWRHVGALTAADIEQAIGRLLAGIE